MGVCVSCGAVISSGSPTCAACGTPQRQQGAGGSGGFCGVCGATLSSKYAPCPKCGHTKTTYNPQPAGGASGHCGQCGAALAAKYAPCPKCGYIKTKYEPTVPPQGALYKSSGTTNLLSILLSLLLLTNGTGHLYLGQIGKGIGLMIGGWVLWGAGIATFMFGVGFAFIIGGFIVMIYSMVDANKQCKIYNEFVSQNGRAPW